MPRETIIAEDWSDLKEHRKRLAESHVSLGGIVSLDHRTRPSGYWLDLARRFAPAALQPISLRRPEGHREGQYVEYHLDKALSRPLHVFSEGELNFLEALSPEPAEKTGLPLLLHRHGASRNPDATHSSVLTRLSGLNSKSKSLGWGKVVCSIPVGSDQYVFGVPHENARRLNLPLVASIEPHLAERNREIVAALRRAGPSTPNEVARVLGLPVEKNTAKAILDSVNTVNNVSVFFHGKKLISVGRYGKGSKKSMYKLWLTEETPEGGPRWKFTGRQAPFLRAIGENPGITIAQLAANFKVKSVFAWQRVNELRTARIPGHEGPVVIAGGMQGGGGGLILSPTFAEENGFIVVSDPVPLLLPRSLHFLYPHFLAGRIQKDGTGRLPGSAPRK